MSELDGDGNNVAPKPLRTARVILYVQGVATLLQTALFVWVIIEAGSHGQEVTWFARPLVVADLLLGVLALVSAATIVAQGRPWSWLLAVVVEVFAILFGLINVFTGSLPAVVGLVLAIVVVRSLFRADVQEWLDHSKSAEFDAGWNTDDG